jgi:hypothetical protein
MVERRREAAARRRAAEAEKLALFRTHMDPARSAELKRQAEMQLEMQQAYKRGDTKTVERLARLLAPPK